MSEVLFGVRREWAEREFCAACFAKVRWFQAGDDPLSWMGNWDSVFDPGALCAQCDAKWAAMPVADEGQ